MSSPSLLTVIEQSLNNVVSAITGVVSRHNSSNTAHSDIRNSIPSVDNAMSSSSTNAVQNKIVKSALDSKVDKVSGKGLSTNDYTSAEKTKLAGIDTGANKTVVDSALSSSSSNPVQNQIITGALDSKLNSVDVQAKIFQYLQKDRINNEANYQKLNDEHSYIRIHSFNGTAASSEVTKIELTDNTSQTIAIVDGDVELNSTVTIKNIDGTVIGTSSYEKETNAVYYQIFTLSGATLGVGIHYLYGECTISGSLRRTPILCVYVKDTTNKLGCNAWSGGEYNNNTSNTSTGAGQTIQITNEHSSIGESSFKIIRTGSTSNWSEFPISQSVSSFTVTADIYSPVANGNMYALIKYTDGTQSFSNVSFQPNTSFQEFSVSTSSNGKTISFISLRLIVNHYDAPVYVDNLRIV